MSKMDIVQGAGFLNILQPKPASPARAPYVGHLIFGFIVTSELKETPREHLDLFEIPEEKKQFFENALKRPEGFSEEDDQLLDELEKLFNEGLTEKNYVKYFQNLLWLEETEAQSNLRKHNLEGVNIIRGDRKWIFQFDVPGLSANRPSLIPGDMVILECCNSTRTSKGWIERTFNNTAEINVLCADRLYEEYEDFEECWIEDGKYNVSFVLSRATFERMHKAVTSVFDGSRRRVYPQKNPSTISVRHIAANEFLNPLIGLNPEQRLAVGHMVSGSSGVAPYILHGPPGTGKTVTIVEAILQLIRKNSVNKILVCADSNMAADNVASSLLHFYHKNFDFDDEKKIILRVNSNSRKRDTIPKDLKKHSIFAVKETTLDGARIIVATLSHTAKYGNGFYTSRLRGVVKFTHLFIDEAAQASEPACLIPITGLLQSNGSLVLAGDNKQLGPVVMSQEASRRGLGLSLMERLHRDCPLYDDSVDDSNYSVMLRNNFRSHPDILALPNELFYGGKLRYLADDKDPISCKDILDRMKPSRAIIFHAVRSKEIRTGKSPSFFNPMELDVLKDYILSLTRLHGVKPDEIGVVTPYNLQVCKIKSWLQTVKSLRNGVQVGTVESFQGKEKRVIIISTVRAKNALGFLVDDKRFNVALTRAKAKVIVIGNPLCLRKDDKWRRYMELCRSYGTYVGFDPQLDDDDGSDEQEETDDDLAALMEFLMVSPSPPAV